ncbi:MAG: SIMPL domain-containing protein [Candidatus Pristimantibacillus sp.]
MYGDYSFNGENSVSLRRSSTIEVLGEGRVSAAPDQAIIVLGVETEGTVLSEVQAENGEMMASIITSLLNLNIPREKIQTSEFRIDIQYDYPEGEQIFRGYKAIHLLQITLDEVDQTGEVVDTALANGANVVSNIQFALSQPGIYKNEALSLALEDARQKAATIANTLGVTIAAVPDHVQELTASPPPSLFKSAIVMSSADTPIQPGQLSISSAVRVRYSLL